MNEAQARKMAAEASEKARSQDPNAAPPAIEGESCDAWIVRWTEDRRARGLAVARETPGWCAKWISPVIGRVPMRDVSSAHIESIVERLDKALRAREIRSRTAEKYWATLKAAFRDAKYAKNKSLRVRLDNPTIDVRGPESGVERSKQWLYPCEFSQLMACERIPLRWRRLFAVATYLYLRAGEVAALRVEDVDLVGGVVLVHRTLSRGVIGSEGDGTKPTKTTVTHRVPIEANLRPLLQVLIAEARAKGRDRLVDMPTRRDIPDQLRRYLRWAGVTRAALFANDTTRARLTFHDLRATGMTWRAVRGDHPAKIQRAVGHLSLETTERYIREAEVIGQDIGEPFPPLPPSVLPHHLTGFETHATSGPTNEANRGKLPVSLPRLPLRDGYEPDALERRARSRALVRRPRASWKSPRLLG